MSFQAMTWAVQQDLPTNQKMVLIMLANRTNCDTGRCDPSHKRLAGDCGMSISTLKRCIKQLEEASLLEVINRKAGDVNLPNQYKLNLEQVGSQRPHPNPDDLTVGSDRTEGVGSERPTKQELYNQEDKQEDLLIDAFDVFWNAGMRKVSRPNAFKSFCKHIKDHTLDPVQFANTLRTDVQNRIQLKQFGFDKLHPTTYLNQERWKDEYQNDQDLQRSYYQTDESRLNRLDKHTLSSLRKFGVEYCLSHDLATETDVERLSRYLALRGNAEAVVQGSGRIFEHGD